MKRNLKLTGSLLFALSLALGFSAIPISASSVTGETLTPGVIDDSLTEGQAVFEKSTGKVTMIETLEDGRTFVRLKNKEGGETDFYIKADTVIVDDEGLASFEDIKTGDNLTAYYIPPIAMIMIYPAQYEASVLVLHAEEDYARAKVSVFDKDFLNAEKDLVITVDKDTEILTQAGGKYEGSLTDKALIIFYDIVLESFPAQTTPEKIIVLDHTPEKTTSESEVPVPDDILNPSNGSEIPDKLSPENFAAMTIFVNGEYVEDARVYVDEQGEILFPLRSIAEAMGYTVGWDAELGKIMVGVAITLSPGSTEFAMGRMAPQHLSVAPVIVDGITYVPGDFITTALMGNIDISQGIYNITELSDEVQ